MDLLMEIAGVYNYNIWKEVLGQDLVFRDLPIFHLLEFLFYLLRVLTNISTTTEHFSHLFVVNIIAHFYQFPQILFID